MKALVIGEDWCPDVWRGLPVIAKVAEQTGMELRIFFRDQNKDIMSEFLNQGEFESNPHDRASTTATTATSATGSSAPSAPTRRWSRCAGILSGVERDTPAYEEARARYTEETWKLAPDWRHAEVAEIRALIENALA